ncbi:dynein light chain Tctex-type [Drosophila grimshawi]|uniref:GH13948 n=1 Tax=Drosophila grimshawi TaxID=7222 RepID=B4IZ13_DROGR|nr:dynein light chain Tctex-type [Drosophila grimshawi]EDV97721.1 GH14539 [Drosophila grimshawi]EDW04686.1 GH13948 [Drosophila grimshawi]
MPGSKSINVSRSKAHPAAERKARSTQHVTITGDKNKASEENVQQIKPVASVKTDEDSDTDSEEAHSEAQPATDVTIYNEYSMGPAFGCKFPLQFIHFMVNRVLSTQLKGKTYQPGDATKWVRDVADNVNLKMQGYCRQHRFKHVVNVVIYQQTGAGFHYGFRAVWDVLADDHVRVTFDAGTLVCIVTVFGCYQY